jgi:hypothetical protein
MEKRCALFLLVVLSIPGFALSQTNAPAAPTAASVDLFKVSDTDLAAMAPDEWKKLLTRLDEQTKTEGLSIVESRTKAVKVQMEARRNNPDVKAVDAKIAELRKQIQQIIDAMPEVKAHAEAASQAQQRLIQLSKTKMKVLTFVNALNATNAPAATPQGK